MRNVLVGAGATILLGLITGMVGCRWANLRQAEIKLPADHPVSQRNCFGNNLTLLDLNSTFPRSTNNYSTSNNSSIDLTNSSHSTKPPSTVENYLPSGNHTIVPFTANANVSSAYNSSIVGSRTTNDLLANESTTVNSLFSFDDNSTESSIGYEHINKNISQPTNSTDDDVDYVKMGEDLLLEATTILDTGIWDFERRTEDGDAIFSRQLDNGNMVYRLTGIVDMPAQDLLVIIFDGVADYPKWNPSLLECRVLEKINDQTDISYTVSAPGARGYVASRDFVSLRHWDIRHNTYIAASKSIEFSRAPHNPDYIRGKNGPGCMELRPLSSDQTRTEFRWLLNTKLNGWIPSYIADKAYKKFMTKYMIFLREYCKKIKQRASDFTVSTTPKNITD